MGNSFNNCRGVLRYYELILIKQKGLRFSYHLKPIRVRIVVGVDGDGV